MTASAAARPRIRVAAGDATGRTARMVAGPAATSGTAEPEQWLIDILGGMATATGLRVSAQDALTVPGVAACVQVLADDLAKVPLVLYRRTPGGGRERATDHPLYRLLKERPAPWLTSFAWRRALVHAAVVYGTGYSRVRRGPEGRPVRIVPIQPGRVTPRWGEDGEPFYDVAQDTGNGRGGSYERGLSFRDVLAAPYRGSTDGAVRGGILGRSPVAMHREAIALALATERFGAKFFANGARPSAVLETDKEVNEAVATRLRRQFEQMHTGLDNTHRVAILELGLKLKEFAATNQDSQLVEIRKQQAAEMATMFEVPPYKIGIFDRMTWANVEQAAIDYVTGTLSSLAGGIEQQLAITLLSEDEQENHFVEFALEGLLRGDIKSRYDAYARGRQWGWLSVDEIRALENMNPLPDGAGQIYLQPSNMRPAGEDGDERAPRGTLPGRVRLQAGRAEELVASRILDAGGRPMELWRPLRAA